MNDTLIKPLSKDGLFTMVNKLFKEPTDNVSIQFFRYTFVGGVSFLVDFSALFLFKQYGKVNYLIAAAIGFIFGIAVNYLLSNAWVFNQRTFKNKWFEFFIFGLIGIVGLGLNEMTMYLLTALLGWYYLVSKIAAAVLIYLWNFSVRKFILYQ